MRLAICLLLTGCAGAVDYTSPAHECLIEFQSEQGNTCHQWVLVRDAWGIPTYSPEDRAIVEQNRARRAER